MKRSDLDVFVKCFNPKNRHQRTETERFKSFSYDELLKRSDVNLDILWMEDESLEKIAQLPDRHTIAQEITRDLQAALEHFAAIAARSKT